MHEVSLVQGMIEQLETLMAKHNASKVLKVVVGIGPFSGVVIDSFKFAFDAIKKDYSWLKDSSLEIEKGPRQFLCLDCNRIFETDDENLLDIFCPRCSKGRVMPYGGDQLLLLRLEME